MNKLWWQAELLLISGYRKGNLPLRQKKKKSNFKHPEILIVTQLAEAEKQGSTSFRRKPYTSTNISGIKKTIIWGKKPYGTFQIVKMIYEYTGHVFYGLVTAELLASPFLYEGVSHEKPGDVKSQKWT